MSSLEEFSEEELMSELRRRAVRKAERPPRSDMRPEQIGLEVAKVAHDCLTRALERNEWTREYTQEIFGRVMMCLYGTHYFLWHSKRFPKS